MMVNYKKFDSFGPEHRNVLVAEDNPGDVVLLKNTFAKDMCPYSLYIVQDGQEAIDFLNENIVVPDVIVLDINMPRVNGHEALKSIRADSRFSSTPVVMLTSSGSEADVAKSQQYGANAYFIKPHYCSLSELISITDMLRLSPSIFVKIEN